MECCQCKCKNSIRWVCGSCNDLPSDSHDILKTPPPTTYLEQSYPMNININNLSSIKKDLFANSITIHKEEHILDTQLKQEHPIQEESQLQLERELGRELGRENILCQEHNQPITFFHQEKHKLLCAICLFNDSANKQVIRPYGLVPIKSSVDLVIKQFKFTLDDISESSRYLDEYLRKSIEYQRTISKHKQYLNKVVGNICQQIVSIIRQKEDQIKESISQRLNQQSKIYQLHQTHLSQLKNNIKSLKQLSNKKLSPLNIKLQQLVYLFQAAKSIKKSLTRNTYKVQDFNLQQYHIKGFRNSRDEFKGYVDSILGWVENKQRKRMPSRPVTKRERYQYHYHADGYANRNKKVFK